MPGIVLSMSDTVSHLIFTDILLRKDSIFSSLQIRQPRVKELECFSKETQKVKEKAGCAQTLKWEEESCGDCDLL